MQVFHAIKSLLGLRTLTVCTLDRRRSGLTQSLAELAAEIPSYSKPAIDDISAAITLEAIAFLAKRQPHPFLGAYISHVMPEDESRVTKISSAFVEDIERLGIVGWVPRILASAIEASTFKRSPNEKDQKHIAAIAFFMAQLCVEEFGELIRWRLPNT